MQSEILFFFFFLWSTRFTLFPCRPAQSGGLWTDEDIEKLIKLVKKYPSGTLERWEKIAEAMERSVLEVTHMAQRVKEDGYRAPNPERR